MSDERALRLRAFREEMARRGGFMNAEACWAAMFTRPSATWISEEAFLHNRIDRINEDIAWHEEQRRVLLEERADLTRELRDLPRD